MVVGSFDLELAALAVELAGRRLPVSSDVPTVLPISSSIRVAVTVRSLLPEPARHTLVARLEGGVESRSSPLVSAGATEILLGPLPTPPDPGSLALVVLQWRDGLEAEIARVPLEFVFPRIVLSEIRLERERIALRASSPEVAVEARFVLRLLDESGGVVWNGPESLFLEPGSESSIVREIQPALPPGAYRIDPKLSSPGAVVVLGSIELRSQSPGLFPEGALPYVLGSCMLAAAAAVFARSARRKT